MATHFARRTLGPELSISPRLSADALKAAQLLPEHRRSRFLASRSLLAELVFMLYGIPVLPEIVVNEQGRPRFTDPALRIFLSPIPAICWVWRLPPKAVVGWIWNFNPPLARLRTLSHRKTAIR